MGNLARILLLSLPLTVTLSCSLDTQTDPGEETTVPSAAPIEVPLDESVPEVTVLVKGLLAKARAESKSGLPRGELGMAYEVNGFPDAAFASYRQAELLDPDEARWPYYQALMLAGLGQQQKALQALDRAIDIDATHASAWMWRGTWSLDVGLVDEADEAFKKAEALGLAAVAKASQARVRLHQHRPDEAVALLEPLSREAQYPSVFQLLGRAYRETGRLDDARVALARGKSAQRLTWQDDWQDSKRTYEVGFQARVRHAQRLLKLNRTGEAKQSLRSLLEERPDNEVVINTLASAYVKNGELQKAFWTLEKALERPPVHYTIHLNIAPFYENRGDPATALAHLDRAIELKPAAALPYTRKGLLLQKQRRYEDALAAFESALRNDATDPHVFFYAGDVEAILQRLPRAIQRFEESVRIDPSFTLGHLNLGLALAKSNRLEEARVSLDRADALGTHESDVQGAFKHLAELEERSE